MACQDGRALIRRVPLGPPAVVEFGAMSLDRVELRSLYASQFRFKDAFDLEKSVFVDVKWPRQHDREDRRPLLADEAALESLSKEKRKGSGPEVERIYRGIRKNLEDHGARVAAHDWYFSEMEVGKDYAPVCLLDWPDASTKRRPTTASRPCGLSSSSLPPWWWRSYYSQFLVPGSVPF